MSLLSIALVIVVAGVLLWAANTYIPMEARLKTLLNIVVALMLVLWLLQSFGLIPGHVRLR